MKTAILSIALLLSLPSCTQKQPVRETHLPPEVKMAVMGQAIDEALGHDWEVIE